jgi:hypothetical protein
MEMLERDEVATDDDEVASLAVTLFERLDRIVSFVEETEGPVDGDARFERRPVGDDTESVGCERQSSDCFVGAP